MVKVIGLIVMGISMTLISGCNVVYADQIGEASYFTRASCMVEGTGTLMSNGKELRDELLICASWFYPLGTKVRISSCLNGKSVICEVTSRGPARSLVKKGRIIDLSKRAFSELAPLERGIIQVEVRRVVL